MQNETRLERAKQFLPFESLKGFQEVLRRQEKILEEQVELEDEKTAKINRILCSLKEKDNIKITYYDEGVYRTEEICIKKISIQKGRIILNRRLFLEENIRDIEIIPILHT